MNVVVLILATAYAAILTFGAWTIILRHRWLAFIHMTAAGLVMIGGVAAFYVLLSSTLWLGAGVLIGWIASWIAALRFSRVVVRNHLVRAGFSLLLVLLAYFAVNQP